MFCGGSILTTKAILTAAHCKTSVNKFVVVVGEHDITAGNDGQNIVPSNWINHPNYNSRTVDYDFAVVLLKKKLTWSESVRPICLPPLSASDSVRLFILFLTIFNLVIRPMTV